MFHLKSGHQAEKTQGRQKMIDMKIKYMIIIKSMDIIKKLLVLSFPLQFFLYFFNNVKLVHEFAHVLPQHL